MACWERGRQEEKPVACWERGRREEKPGAVPEAMAEWHDFWSGSDGEGSCPGDNQEPKLCLFSFKCQVVMAEGWVDAQLRSWR